MGHYVVVGAGPVGRETARLLAEDGHSVTLTSRNAGSIDAGDVRTISSDATDAVQLAALAKGADAIFMCAMAAYHRWPTDFFPIMDGTVKAAEQVGARLLVAGNVYGYGAVAVSPLTPDLEPAPTSRKGTTRRKAIRRRTWHAGATLLQSAMHRLRLGPAIVWRHGEEGTFAEGTSRGLQGRIRAGRLCISSTDRPIPRPCPCESGIGEGLAARCKVATVAEVRLGAKEMTYSTG